MEIISPEAAQKMADYIENQFNNLHKQELIRKWAEKSTKASFKLEFGEYNDQED